MTVLGKENRQHFSYEIEREYEHSGKQKGLKSGKGVDLIARYWKYMAEKSEHEGKGKKGKGKPKGR